MTTARPPLDQAAFAVLHALTATEINPGARTRAALDRAILALQHMLNPRLRLLIRQHGLADHADDAAQACLMAMVDAARRWDPARSGFGTWLGWQWRGVMVGLRRQLLGDTRSASGQIRRSSRSIDDGASNDILLNHLIDPDAEAATMRGAADWLAQRYADHLLDAAQSPLAAARASGGAGHPALRLLLLGQDGETGESIKPLPRHQLRKILSNIRTKAQQLH